MGGRVLVLTEVWAAHVQRETQKWRYQRSGHTGLGDIRYLDQIEYGDLPEHLRYSAETIERPYLNVKPMLYSKGQDLGQRGKTK